MGESSKGTALRVAKAAFEGLATLLLEHGVTSSEAEILLRAVCVHQAARTHSGSRPRPNISRISVKTGIDRHTVATLLKSSPDLHGGLIVRRDSMSRVIDGWLTDARYSKGGTPRELDIGDPGSKGWTLWSLVQSYAPGVWPRLIIDELIRVNYVEALPNGRLKFKARSQGKSSRHVSREEASQQMTDALRALFSDVKGGQGKRVWRTAQGLEIGKNDLPLVRKMLRDRLESMFAQLTEELNSPRWQRDVSKGGSRMRVGLSGFTFEELLVEGR
jgi:hypothetical protein